MRSISVVSGLRSVRNTDITYGTQSTQSEGAELEELASELDGVGRAFACHYLSVWPLASDFSVSSMSSVSSAVELLDKKPLECRLLD
jgi:hypothetical protein